MGRPSAGRGLLLTRRVSMPAHLKQRHLAAWYVYLVEQWLATDVHGGFDVRLRVPEADVQTVQARCAGWPPLVIGLNPGATNSWPARPP